mmetsp:Transcript_46330/g.119572  ORF Transcript_46330/g.119572 Transcript_46330/m.119572 type:complete len:158 (+) Transcript_46330:675-1148(+)
MMVAASRVLFILTEKKTWRISSLKIGLSRQKSPVLLFFIVNFRRREALLGKVFFNLKTEAHPLSYPDVNTSCSFLRKLDREIHSLSYPRLYYPNIYVLDGGFSQFYERYPNYCKGCYVRMEDSRYTEECKKERMKRRQMTKEREKQEQLQRSRSFQQ